MRPVGEWACDMRREAERADGAHPAEEQACCNREVEQADGIPGAVLAAHEGQLVSAADTDFRQAGAAWKQGNRSGALPGMQWRQRPP